MAFFNDIKSALVGDSPAPAPRKAPSAAAEQKAVVSVNPGKPEREAMTIGAKAKWTVPDGRGGEKTIHARSYPFLPDFEPRHMLVCGTTGAGKSRLFYNMFDQIRERRTDRALVIDVGGESLARYWRPGDVVLNPFDDRFPGWNPFAEIKDVDFDTDMLAQFVVPDGDGDNAAWQGYAQSLFASILRTVVENNDSKSIKNILRLMLHASPEALRTRLSEEPACGLFLAGSEKMAANARSILGAHLTAWRHMQPRDPEATDAPGFSIRDWIGADQNDQRWVFVSFKESHHAALRGFISMVISIAASAVMDLEPSDDRRIWFSLDECASLGKVQFLPDLLAKGRKFGACCVVGLQSVSQWNMYYGRDGAQTLLSNINTYVCSRPGDHQTAAFFADHFGKQDALRRGYSDNAGTGGGGVNQGEGISAAWHEQHVISYTELMMLDDLKCCIKWPGNIPLGYMGIPYTGRQVNVPPFIPRKPRVIAEPEIAIV